MQNRTGTKMAWNLLQINSVVISGVEHRAPEIEANIPEVRTLKGG